MLAGNFATLIRSQKEERRVLRKIWRPFSDSFGRQTHSEGCVPAPAAKILIKSSQFSAVLHKSALRIPKFKMESPQAAKRLRTEVIRGKKIAIEGNIATGKSTFIKMLEEESAEWHVVPEPVARWTSISTGDDEAPLTMSQKSGGNLLQMFYDDIGRWSYTFQSYALLSRMRLQRKGIPEKLYDAKNPVQFFERSLQSDRYIFALNCYESGLMSETEWNIYQDWSSYLVRSLGELKLDGIIYLRAQPEVCYSRMQKRGRDEEKGVGLDYLTCLHKKHDDWLYHNNVQMDESLVGVPILTLDCNEEFANDPKRKSEMMDKVTKFVQSGDAMDDSGLESNNVSSNSDEGNSDIEY